MKRRDAALLAEIIAYVHEHLDREIHVKDLCAQFGINRNKLQTGFHTLTGKPVRTYLISTRMETAAQRLQDTDDPIKMIAMDLGYKTSANFGKTFKLFFGTSPVEFRKQKQILPDLRQNH